MLAELLLLTELTDEELVQRCTRGDRLAFNELAHRHQQRMYSICRRITCDEQDAKDALQEALIAAWRHIRNFEGRAHIGTWLYRVATNAAIDEVRRKARRPAPSGDMVPRLGDSSPLEDAVSDRMAVDWAMAKIPPQFRAAVVLREFCGLSYQTIAEIRDIPIDTVKSQISRGRQALVELLKMT
ncbi:sigma-70 family RNA polymerase sigma factor [Microbispora hainanensis]|jgi:RNA polymerase sigma-70 factor (ECF subfamily)|uniref:Sigma-70 family RNA polymerase sigma factor n=1 Tax=Microbispora hainanensis TaxID=568844 RepID=A0ABZ1SHT5_9ACTN|nr:sigma-70 family RNA polymerase sigma factor [Microbispora hainanensis]